MIFDKNYLLNYINELLVRERRRVNPFERTINENDKSPFDIMLYNYYTFFDLKSTELKGVLQESRRNITKNCFNTEDNGTYPNTEKIESCIKKYSQTQAKYENIRDLYSENSIFLII